MNAAEIIAIAQLVNVLTPPAIEGLNLVIEAFKDMPADDRLKKLNELAATLTPMVPK